MPKTGIKESSFQSEVIKYIKSRGGYVVKVHVSSYESQGEPDLVVCYKGKFVALELKVDGNKTSKLQEHKLKKISQAGGIARSIYTLKEVEETLNEILRVQSGNQS